MSISDLIEKLNEIRAEHGDYLEVVNGETCVSVYYVYKEDNHPIECVVIG